MNIENPLLKLLGDAVQGYGAAVLNYALVLAAVATLAMALVELVKTVLRLRLRYHRWAVQAWTDREPRRLGGLLARTPCFFIPRRATPFMQGNRTLDELLVLATGGHDDGDALYDQPVEKMMAQVQAAANIAIQFPQEFPHLYAFLAGVQWKHTPRPVVIGKSGRIAAEKDETERSAVAEKAEKDGALWARRVEAGPAATRPVDPTDPAPPPDPDQAAAAKAKLNNRVLRKLDAFQAETQYLWERLNQWVAAACCAGMLWYLLIGTGKLDPLSAFPLALIGGVAAPFAKDVATALASFGRSR